MTTAPVSSIAAIEARIAPLRARLTAHPLYASIRTREHLQIFMQSHVFAVWDFMSLLKALQTRLTCTTVPWTPSAFPESRRFINEIVLGEESDLYEGRAISHFELYLEAMRSAGADTSAIDALNRTQDLDSATITAAARAFMRATFSVIDHGSTAAIAAAFTFGREDAIPDIFRALVRNLNQQTAGDFSTFLWYLERHIEVDGEDHGPLSLRMVADLCGADDTLWQQASDAAASAIEARLALWDGIHSQITTTA